MAAGDKEILQAFEEVTTRNVRAAVDYSMETRKLTRKLEKKVDLLEGNIRQLNQRLDSIQSLLANVQAKLYAGGTV